MGLRREPQMRLASHDVRPYAETVEGEKCCKRVMQHPARASLPKMIQIASAMSDRKDRWQGHVSDELNLDSLVVVSYQKLWVSQGLGVRVLRQNDNCGSVTNALGKEPLNCAGGALAKATGCSADPMQTLKRMGCCWLLQGLPKCLHLLLQLFHVSEEGDIMSSKFFL